MFPHRLYYKKSSLKKSLKKKFFYNKSWLAEQMPVKQWKIVSKQIDNFEKVPEMKALANMMQEISKPNDNILEIGCSSGYYSQIFNKCGLNLKYTGCDISPHFIKFAKEKFGDNKNNKFLVSDATALPFKDEEFEVAISGCCILHIVDYAKAVAETARVAKKYVIFHRTPTIIKSETRFFEKKGYDQKMIEIIFNEQELLELFKKNNLILINKKIIFKDKNKFLKEEVENNIYLCEKIQSL